MPTPLMHPTQHERAEWARFAAALNARGYFVTAQRFLLAAGYPDQIGLTAAHFDSLQTPYRAWLCFGEMP